MLFVSSVPLGTVVEIIRSVSISESRCFSFQEILIGPLALPLCIVSISESRCFSFQVEGADTEAQLEVCFNLGIEMLFVSSAEQTRRFGQKSFQTRFNLGIEMLFVSRSNTYSADNSYYHVSISESRCFSFQVFIDPSAAHPKHVSISESRCFSFQEKVNRYCG